jgi:hypothetical protein
MVMRAFGGHENPYESYGMIVRGSLEKYRKILMAFVSAHAYQEKGEREGIDLLFMAAM